MVLESDALASVHHTSARAHKQVAQGTALYLWRVSSGDAVAIEMGCGARGTRSLRTVHHSGTTRGGQKAVNCGQLWISQKGE
jgi:hypothetical protein